MYGDIPRAPRLLYNDPGVPETIRLETYIPIQNLDVGGSTPALFSGIFNSFELNPIEAAPIFLFDGGPEVVGLGTVLTTDPINTSLPIGSQASLAFNAPLIAAAETLEQPGEVTLFSPSNSFAVLEQKFLQEVANYSLNFSVLYFDSGELGYAVGLVNPVDGAVVGRTKVSTNNNPLPRDRFIYDFDYLDEAQLTAAGVDMHRHQFGFEKTFLGGWTSVAVRAPFASTLDTDISLDDAVGGTQATNTEFGNLQIDLKGLLLRGSDFNLSSGLGISLPTANDVRVREANGDTFLRVANDTVVLKPFLAALWTPNSRFFAQSWMQFTFDTQGNPVYVGEDLLVGRMNDATTMAFDTQLGYWLISPQESTGRLRGLAPFAELHYNTSVTDTDVLNLGGNVLLYDVAGRVDELSLSTGVITQLGDNTNLTLGMSLPTRGGDDRFSDWNLGLRVNHFFGPTARDRSAAMRVSSY
jgi:hypothetical protein